MRLQLSQVDARHPAARAGTSPALRSVSLQVASGEQVAVIGPSGAGKTSLLHVLACALPPSSGEFALDDTSPWRLSTRRLQRLRGELFLAPQVPPLPPRQRVVTAVLAGRLPRLGLWASLRALVRPDDLPGAQAALQRFDLADKLFERVDRLSGGERQRVALARALLAPAQLWLLDEPLSSLDPTRARQALDALVQAARERGVTLVTSLHQVELALAAFPRIVGLRDGQVVFDLPAAEVTPERLAQLYAQHEDELRAAPQGPASLPPPDVPAPVAMQCR